MPDNHRSDLQVAHIRNTRLPAQGSAASETGFARSGSSRRSRPLHDCRYTLNVRELLGKEGNQAPAHQNQLAIARLFVITDYGLERGRGDVMVRFGDDRAGGKIADIEGLADVLFTGSSVIAATHATRLNHG
jgi:hypothetical protein